MLLYFVIPKEAEQNKFYIILMHVIPSLIFNVTTIMATRYYQFAGKPIFISSVSALVGIIAIFSNYFAIAYFGLGYMGWFISNFISSFIAFIFYFFSVYFKIKIFPIIAFRRKFLTQSLKISLPLIPHNYSAYLLNTSDRVVMDRLKVSTSSIGQYNLAYTFGSYMEFFGNAIGMAIGPIYTSMFSDKSVESSKKVKSLTEFLQVLFIFSSFLVSLWCKEIFGLLIKNDSLNSVYPLAIIIIMGYSYRPYYWTAITRLQYSENTKDLWKITLVAGLLNLLLNIIFIPFFGIIAAAISTFLCLLYMGFSGYYLKSFKKVEKESYSPEFYIIVILVTTICVYLLKDASLIIKFGISAALIFYILRFCLKYLKHLSN
jgi:O-antigen/teichoic acid export membrane protein